MSDFFYQNNKVAFQICWEEICQENGTCMIGAAFISTAVALWHAPMPTPPHQPSCWMLLCQFALVAFSESNLLLNLLGRLSFPRASHLLFHTFLPQSRTFEEVVPSRVLYLEDIFFSILVVFFLMSISSPHNSKDILISFTKVELIPLWLNCCTRWYWTTG